MIIFGRSIDKDQKRCFVQESQLLVSPEFISPEVTRVLTFWSTFFQSDILPLILITFIIDRDEEEDQ